MNYEILSIGEINYRTDYRRIYNKSHSVHLSPTEHKLFVLFAQKFYEFVSIVKIMDTLYEIDAEPTFESIATVVSRLRKKTKPFGLDIFSKRIKNNEPKTYSRYKMDYIK